MNDTHTHQCSCCAPKVETKHSEVLEKISFIASVVATCLFVFALGLQYFTKYESRMTVVVAMMIVAYVLIAYDILWLSIKNVGKGNFLDENFLMAIASVGAIYLKDYSEAVAVIIFYKVGEYYQEKAVAHTKKSIKSLLNLKPQFATVKSWGITEQVAPEKIRVGDIIVVANGEKVAVDGIVTKGTSYVNTAMLTGESVERPVDVGVEVLSGVINAGPVFEMQATKVYAESTISKIIELIENSASKKPAAEKFITAFAKVYTPIVVVIAVLVAVVPVLFGGSFSLWLSRALIFLVISCPCALVLSIPLTFFSVIGYSASQGLLIKGGQYIEKLNKIKCVIFDKTGTLTHGNFVINKVVECANLKSKEILGVAKVAACRSKHPLSKLVADTVIEGYDPLDENNISHYEEIAGNGVYAKYFSDEILLGNEKLLAKFNVVVPQDVDTQSKTALYVALNNKLVGVILVADEVRTTSRETIEELKKLGKEVFMLTGDTDDISKQVGTDLTIPTQNIYSSLMPADKVSKIEEIKSHYNDGVIFVGEGINDGPALVVSDIGISMGKTGSDIAIESSDIVLMKNEPLDVVKLLHIAKKTKSILMQNIIFILGIKVIIMLLGVLGYANLWLAIFGDVGVSIIAILNAQKILGTK